MTKVGFEVIQFNLMKPELTNVFNPLINAIQKFRQNDVVKGTALIDNIVETLFPDNGEIWNPAAGNMFRRAVYILFDYHLEQEAYIRYLGYKNNVAQEIIEDAIDKLYSKITLYNVYSLVGELAAKVSSDLEFINIDPDPKAPKSSSKDLLTLLFDAIEFLPLNPLRSLAITANNAIKQIANAPQTLAGIYASLLTGISVYADPTTIALMSGSISDSFDVSGMAFPRRFGVQLDKKYVDKYRLTAELAKWTCYRDKDFTIPYEGSKYQHEERIPVSNWIWGYFEGIFEEDDAYLKLDIESNGTIAKTFYFQFTKGYKTFNSITYRLDPITHEKVISGGILTELDPISKEPKVSEFDTMVVDYQTKSYREKKQPVVVSSQCYYTERPKFISAITPPHLQGYQKHILIIIKQIIDEIYSMSYSTKANRKPIVGTRLMLEEFGNIRSGENGIPNIDTVTSIALGQDLQLTFVLQSFQQLRALYKEDVEKILRANSANIIFLKSNDEELINELTRLSGVRHEVKTKGFSVSRKVGDLITISEPAMNYSRDHTETTALTSNDLLFLAGKSPGNSITFMSNEMPVVNKGAHIMPMAAGLHSKLPQPAGGQYSDSTLPSTNTADGMNFLENTIDGEALVKARVAQARIAIDVKKVILDIADKHQLHISERNGDLSLIMMNTVYELYESNAGEVRVELASTVTYHEITTQLSTALSTIQDRSLPANDRLAAANVARDILVRCAMDKELEKYTVVYKDKPADNPLGFDPDGVGTFLMKMKRAFPAPIPLKVDYQDVFSEAKNDARYTPYESPDLTFDLDYSYHANIWEELIQDILDKISNPPHVSVRKHDKDVYDMYVDEVLIGKYTTLEGSYVVDYVVKPKEFDKLLQKKPALLHYLMDKVAKL